jgi:hypothetical protein
MIGQPRIYVDEINDFLATNNAKLFTYTWGTLLREKRGLRNTKVTMILAPSDAALNELTRISNRTWQEIISTQEGRDILENHVSVVHTQKEWPMFTAINNTKYGRGPSDLDALLPTASTIINEGFSPAKISIIIIDRVILHSDQLAKLKQSRVGRSVWRRADPAIVQIEIPPAASDLTGSEIPKMTRDIFRLMVVDQNLRGRDLLALCTSNNEIATLCDRDDQLLFKDLLKQEFNFDYSKRFARETPREFYAKLHSFRIEVYIRYYLDIYQEETLLVHYSLIRHNENKPSTSIGKDLVKVSQVVSLPLQDWFGYNFSSVSREVVYMIYVYGVPESATLIRRVLSDDWPGVRVSYITSNDWFDRYFHGRSFVVNNPDFNSNYTADGLIMELLRQELNTVAMTVQLDDASPTIIFTWLKNGELY